MPTRSARTFSLALIVSDFLTILAAFVLSYVIRVELDPRPLVAQIRAVDFFTTFLIIAPFWIVVFGSLGLYSPNVYSRRLSEMGRLLIGSFTGILVILGYVYVTNQPFFPARLVAVYALFGSFGLLLVSREIMRQLRRLLFGFGIGISRVLIIGNSPATRHIAEALSDTPRSGYHMVALAGPPNLLPDGLKLKHFHRVEEALARLDELRITTIIQTDLYDSPARNQLVLGAAQARHISYSFIPGEAEFYSGKNTVDVFLGYPMISVHQTPLVGWGEVVKRIFDLTLVLLALPLLLPLFLLLAGLQKLFNPGPVFYLSDRLTRYSKPFKLYKFRSMRPEFGRQDAAKELLTIGRPDLAEEYIRYRKVKNDPRVTGFGRLLRITSLDELPQLINVLKGDLSLVGPRPILPQEMKYAKKASLLHSVKSGITGLWQVSGRNDLSFQKRIELELYYAQNWSFWLDVKILLKTIRVVLWRAGAR